MVDTFIHCVQTIRREKLLCCVSPYYLNHWWRRVKLGIKSSVGPGLRAAATLDKERKGLRSLCLGSGNCLCYMLLLEIAFVASFFGKLPLLLAIFT